MTTAEFYKFVEKVALEFKATKAPVKLVSNLDADGISAGAIAAKALKRLNRQHSISIIHQLREKELLELKEEDYDIYMFTDLGSGALELIEKTLPDKQILILDHHEPHGTASGNVWHVNPHLFGINGSDEISASGVTFFFARALDKENEDMAHIAIVGAIGDVQENNGFTGLNQQILDIAVKKKVIKLETGLNFFGIQTRPLHKLLEYSSDMDIPDVSGSESGAIQFLQSLDIDPKNGYGWKLFHELDDEEKKRLTAGIIMKRVDKKNPENIFTKVYTFPDGEKQFRDAKEFSTLLNACGRLDKASVGIGACLGDPLYRKKALQVHTEYRKEIVTALNWFRDNQNSKYIIRGDNYVIINAENQIMNTIIGTLASILSKGRDFSHGTFILSLARKPENITKISFRVVGNPEGVNLREIIDKIAKQVDGECGGHQYASGAIIKTDMEQPFIDAAINEFKTL